MSANAKTIDVWVLIDENGDYVISNEEDELADKYDNDIGLGAATARRVLHLLITADLPETLVLEAEAELTQAGEITSVK